ncbi:LysR family transcriptional regulator [Algihabitans albus]|uniref:LysR family transcriptional regulator n=1 Tax=Algihabitans albus TaxID=2164067 RepID=UPI000E5C99A1|nr:LysR family transcriptional regulator [Algihabitans albus]
MEFRQLRYFVAVAEEGNIGRAADKLHISQPPVSRQIQALETELGVQLLVRTPKGVEMTEAGRLFFEDARRVLAQVERAAERSRAADRGEIGRLDVAFFGSPVYRAVPLALRAFRRSQPATDVSLVRMGKKDQIAALREGRIHVGFGRYYNQSPGIRIEKLAEEDLYVAVPQDLPLSVRTEVSLDEIAELPLVLFPSGDRPSFADEVIGVFRQEGIDVQVDSIASDSTAALALIATGNRCAIVPEAIGALRFPTLRFVRIANCPIKAPVNCVFSEADRAPVLVEFLKSIRALSFGSKGNTVPV